jgi:hypothetical protein
MKAAFPSLLLVPLALVFMAGCCEPTNAQPKPLLVSRPSVCDTCGIMTSIIGAADTAQRIIGTGDVLDTASISYAQPSWVENTSCYEKHIFRNAVYELHTSSAKVWVTEIETGKTIYQLSLGIVPIAVCMDWHTFSILVQHDNSSS